MERVIRDTATADLLRDQRDLRIAAVFSAADSASGSVIRQHLAAVDAELEQRERK